LFFVTFKVNKLKYVGCRIGAKVFSGSDSSFKVMLHIGQQIPHNLMFF